MTNSIRIHDEYKPIKDFTFNELSKNKKDFSLKIIELNP